MRQIIIFIIFLIATNFCLAQTAELRELCKELESMMSQDKPLHLQCELIVLGRGEKSEQGSIIVNLYKKKDKEDLVMGNAQEVMREGKTMLVINHVNKIIMVREDTTKNFNPYNQLNELQTYIDSASAVQKVNNSGMLIFKLSYPENYIYTKVELSFSEKTKQLSAIYAEFSPFYPEPYASLQVKYQNWDMKWRPGADFPNLEKFVKKSGDTYALQETWKGYKLFQSQKRILKN